MSVHCGFKNERIEMNRSSFRDNYSNGKNNVEAKNYYSNNNDIVDGVWLQYGNGVIWINILMIILFLDTNFSHSGIYPSFQTYTFS